jgi:hypothetical protein
MRGLRDKETIETLFQGNERLHGVIPPKRSVAS